MKIGFIGGWGHHYLRELLRPGVSPIPIEAAAAGDGLDAPAATRFAEAQHITRMFDDPIRMMEEWKPDAVSIGAIYARNSDLAAEAMERGIAVVCDKPVAGNWPQLDRLKALAADPRRILLTEFDFRSRKDFRAAQQAIAQGLIGKVILVTAQKSYRFGARPAWYADRAQYTGTLLWIASHGIDAVDWVAGRTPRRVIGHQGNLSRPDYGTMEDHLAVLMALDNGGTAVVHADFLRPAAAATHGDDRLRIAGSEGVVEVRDYKCTLTTRGKGEVDITDTVQVRPISLELLAALCGEKSDWFSTQQSLSTAALLLHARDATDSGSWVEIHNKP